jgi:hypothetical protein
MQPQPTGAPHVETFSVVCNDAARMRSSNDMQVWVDSGRESRRGSQMAHTQLPTFSK